MAGDDIDDDYGDSSEISYLETRKVMRPGQSDSAIYDSFMPKDQRSAALKSANKTKAIAQQFEYESEDDSAHQMTPETMPGNFSAPPKTKRTKDSAKSSRPRKQRKRKELSYDEYYKRIDQQAVMYENLKKKFEKKSDKLERVLANSESDRIDANESIAKLEERLNKSEKLAEELDEKIGDLQAERVDILGNDEDTALPDNVVRDQLTTLFRESKEWAASWAREEWKDVDQNHIEQILEAIGAGPRVVKVSEITVEAVKKNKIPTRVLLNAIVNRRLSRHTMGHIFDFIRLNRQREYSSIDVGVVEYLLKLVNEHSAAEYQKCRLALLRMLAPTQQSKGRVDPTVRAIITKLIIDHCKHIHDQVLKDACDLMRPCDPREIEKCSLELWELTRSFFQKSLELHAQQPQIKVFWRKNLLEYSFTTNHDYFIGHRGLKLNGTDEESRLAAEEAGFEGREIDLVIEPVILRYGDADGNDLDQHRVVHKASVWMVNTKDLKDSTASDMTDPTIKPNDIQLPEEGRTPSSPIQFLASAESHAVVAGPALQANGDFFSSSEAQVSSHYDQIKSQAAEAKPGARQDPGISAAPNTRGKQRHSEPSRLAATTPRIEIPAPPSLSQQNHPAKTAKTDQRLSTPIKTEPDGWDVPLTPSINSSWIRRSFGTK